MAVDPSISSVQTARPRPAEEAWHEIEDLVHEVARLSKSESSRQAFYAQLLGGAVPALAAVAGAVWLQRPEGLLALECQVNLAQLEIEQHSAVEKAHARLIHLVLRSGRPRIVAPRTGVTDDEQAFNSTPCLALLCPVVLEKEPLGVIEIFQRAGASPAAQRGYLQFLEALSSKAVALRAFLDKNPPADKRLVPLGREFPVRAAVARAVEGRAAVAGGAR